jgi:hypothetical protein
MSRLVRLLTVLAVALSSPLFLAPSALAADAACQPGFDATTKLFTAAVHSYTNETLPGGRSSSGEAIYVNGGIYINLRGKWIHSKMTTQDMLKLEQENIRNSKVSCRYLHEEPVNGEVTSLYMVHSENEGVREDAQTWISKAKGLPVRTEEDVDSGDGDKKHVSIRYEYNHVQAPAGVQ